MEIFDLILEVSNLMDMKSESGDEIELPPLMRCAYLEIRKRII